jgi:hypothetical protein
MGMGVNSYPPVYMGDPMRLFLCRGYGYGVVILGGYLPIAISTLSTYRPVHALVEIDAATRLPMSTHWHPRAASDTRTWLSSLRVLFRPSCHRLDVSDWGRRRVRGGQIFIGTLRPETARAWRPARRR